MENSLSTFFRIEHPVDNLGPWRSIYNTQFDFQVAVEVGRRIPYPYKEGVELEGQFAFRNLKVFKTSFTRSELEECLLAGFKVYEVQCLEYKDIDDVQVNFIRDKATFNEVTTEELSKIDFLTKEEAAALEAIW